MELAKARLDEAKVNPLLNADECTIDYLETMRSNPDRFYIKPKPADIQFQNEQGIPPMNPGSQPMPNEIPGSQVVDNKKILAGVRK
jgi:hypothetical protein